MSAHFRLFALVSSARDAGSGTTQARLLALHLRYWARVLAELVPAATPRLRYTVLSGQTTVPDLAGIPVPVVAEPDRERGRGYYTEAALRITAIGDGAEVELGDGGFTPWTALLMGNAKERCLVSCLSTERLAAILDG
jgi:hypothetical protein